MFSLKRILPIVLSVGLFLGTPATLAAEHSRQPSSTKNKSTLTSIQRTLKKMAAQEDTASINIPSPVKPHDNMHPLVQMEEQVRNRFKADPHADLTSVYLYFLTKVAAYLQTQGVATKIQNSPEGLWLQILPQNTPGDQPDLNRYAYTLAQDGYDLRYMGIDAILKPTYTARLLFCHQEKKQINIGSRALSNIADFLKAASTLAQNRIIQDLKDGKIDFLNNPGIARVGDEFLFADLDPQTPKRDIVIDYRGQIAISANSFARTHFMDFHANAWALKINSDRILERFHLKQHVAQGEIVGLRKSYEHFLTKVAARLQDLNAIIFTMIKRPARVSIESFPNNARHLALKAMADRHHDEFFFFLKFPWPTRPAPTVDELLADATFQMIYRYTYALYAELASANQYMVNYTTSPFTSLQNSAPIWQKILDLPAITQEKVKKELWVKSKWLHKIRFIQPTVRTLLTAPAQEGEIPVPRTFGHTPPRHYLRALEDDYRHRINQLPPLQRSDLFKEYLNKVKTYLNKQDIDADVYDYRREAGQDYWLKILPTNRSKLNRFAQDLQKQGIDLQLMGIRDLQKNNLINKLVSTNFAAKRMYIGSEALNDIDTFLASPEIKLALDTFAKLQQDELAFLANPLIVFNGKRHLPPPTDPRFPYAQLVVDPQLSLVVPVSPKSAASFNFVELYQKSVSLVHDIQVLQEKLATPEDFRKEHLKELQSKFSRLHLAATSSLTDFNVILYLMLNPATQAQVQLVLRPQDQQLAVVATPDPRTPDFLYKLIIPWSRQGSTPSILDVLKDANFQSLYRYNHALFTQFLPVFTQVTTLKAERINKILPYLEQAAFLPDLPFKISQETQEHPWSLKSFEEALTKIQPSALEVLVINFKHHQSLSYARKCSSNFLTLPASQNTPSL